jgi:hypothetical protein
LLPEDERSKLMRFIVPAYPDVIAHHVTAQFGKDPQMPDFVTAEVIGFADDGEGVQALIVRINGSTRRPDGGTYHITWSIDRSKGRKPVDSNTVIAEKGWTPLVVGTTIMVEPHVVR